MRLSLLSSYLPDPFVSDDPREEKRIIKVFVCSCLVSTVSRHVRSAQKEHIHIHKLAAELVVLLKEEDLVVHRIPSEWVLLETFNNVNDAEDLDDFPAETQKNRPNLWLEHIAQSRQINFQQEVE